MKALDEVLDAAAADIRRATEQLPIPTTFPDDGVRLVRRRESHMRVLVGAAAVALLVVGIAWIQARPTDSPSVIPSDVTSTSLAGPGVASLPLELTQTPPGYAMVGQVVRPRAEVNLRSAVFVKRDPQGEVIDKVVVRVGDFSLVGFEQGEIVSAPANLPTAGTGRRVIEESSRVVHVEFLVRDFGHLDLASYHQDATTDLQVADQMLAMAATLDLSTADISVVGSLPDGWELAVSGLEPGYATEEIFQAFEVDVPEGGNKILISNWMTTDLGMPYWEMDETLDPINVRGHSGFVSTITYPPSDPTAPPPPNAGGSTSLIWMEAPGHWVTLRGHDMNVEQVLALAEQLTPAVSGQWGETTGVAVTTTTAQPGSEPATTAPSVIDGEPQLPQYLGLVAAFSDAEAALISEVLNRLVQECMVEQGFEYEPVDVVPAEAMAEDVLYPTPEELAGYGYAWRSHRFELVDVESTTIVPNSESAPGLAACEASADTAFEFSAYNDASQVLTDADSREISASVENDERMLAANAGWKSCMSDAGYEFDTWGEAERSTYPDGMETPSALALAKADYGCRNNYHLAEIELELRREYVAAWVESHPDEMEAVASAKTALLLRAQAVLGSLGTP